MTFKTYTCERQEDITLPLDSGTPLLVSLLVLLACILVAGLPVLDLALPRAVTHTVAATAPLQETAHCVTVRAPAQNDRNVHYAETYTGHHKCRMHNISAF